MTDRPLWRTGTRALAAELKRRGESESVQRAFLQECDLGLLLAEVVARGYAVTPPMVLLNGATDGVPEARRPSLLGKQWPPLADDDVPLPFEVDRDE